MASPVPDPLARETTVDKLFNRAKFRRRTLAVYRVAGPLALAVCLYYLLAGAGIVPEPLEGKLPGWLYSAIVLLTMGIAAITPILFLVSTVGGLATAADWRFAAPLWSFSAAAGLFLVTAFFSASLTRDDQAQVWLLASLLFCVSAAWATVVGYQRKRAPRD